MSSPDISVVIPTRNPNRERLHEVLNALGNQVLPDARHEVCLVDNGSTPALQVPATPYEVRHLVSDLGGGWGDKLDPNLKNPWGIAIGPTTPFWISNGGTGTSTVYNSTGDPFPVASPIIVNIPAGPGRGGKAKVTGQVWNGTAGFEVAQGQPASFIFATENGTISAWNRNVDPANAVLKVDNPNANYKGLASGMGATGPVLYAANFRGGTVDMFDYTFQAIPAPGGFKDPNLPAGFAPFNVARFGKRIYVAYAKQDDAKGDDVSGDGNGYISVFDQDGNFKQRLVSNGPLNSPWGMVIAPAFFGDYSNTLLVGNFGDGKINSFDLASGQHLGALTYRNGNTVALEGLWGLTFGNNRTGGDPFTLYFTAGVSGGPSGVKEDHGVFGAISVSSSNRRAACSRVCWTNSAGVVPVSSRKVRMKLRSLIAARRASAATRRSAPGFSWHHFCTFWIAGIVENWAINCVENCA